MRFIDVQGFCVRQDRQVEFQRWIVANEERIRKAYPDGVEYGGIYAAVMSTEKNSGEYYWLDILDSYGAMDRIAAAGKDAASDYAKITGELLEFLDPNRSAGWSRTLLKSVVDATIVDIPAS